MTACFVEEFLENSWRKRSQFPLGVFGVKVCWTPRGHAVGLCEGEKGTPPAERDRCSFSQRHFTLAFSHKRGHGPEWNRFCQLPRWLLCPPQEDQSHPPLEMARELHFPLDEQLNSSPAAVVLLSPGESKAKTGLNRIGKVQENGLQKQTWARHCGFP